MKQIEFDDVVVGTEYFIELKNNNARLHHHGRTQNGVVVAIDAPFIIIKNDFKEKIPINVTKDVVIYEAAPEFLALLND